MWTLLHCAIIGGKFKLIFNKYYLLPGIQRQKQYFGWFGMRIVLFFEIQIKFDSDLEAAVVRKTVSENFVMLFFKFYTDF